MSSIVRAVIDSIIPPGSFWRVAIDEELDKLYDGIADCWEPVRVFLAALKNTRNPENTAFLEELEQEFGVLTNLSITEQQRRDQLSPIIYNRASNGGKDNLQNALNAAGFDVQVHENSPAVDPNIFLLQDFKMIANGGNAFAGRADAFAGIIGGKLLVNGRITKTIRTYLSVAGRLYAGDGVTAGQFGDDIIEEVKYEISSDPFYWPYVFFVGGDATRDGLGQLTSIDLVDIQVEQKEEFERLILKYKPLHSWAALIINYT